MLVFQRKNLVNAWLLVLGGKVEDVVPLALRGIVIVMTLRSASFLCDRIHQSQGNNLGFFEVLVLEAHILILHVGAPGAMARFATHTDMVGRCGDIDETTGFSITDGMTGQAFRIGRVVLVGVQSRIRFFSSTLTRFENVERFGHGRLGPRSRFLDVALLALLGPYKLVLRLRGLWRGHGKDQNSGYQQQESTQIFHSLRPLFPGEV